MILTVEELGIVGTDSTDHLDRRVVVDRSDPRLFEELGSQLSVADAKRELLFLG